MPSRGRHSALHASYLIEPLEDRVLLIFGMVGDSQDLGVTLGPIVAHRTASAAFIVDQDNRRLLGIEALSGTTRSAAPLETEAAGMALARDGSKIYVSEPGELQIEVFSRLPGLSLIDTLEVGIAVDQIVIGANNRIIGMSGGDIKVIDGATGAVIHTLEGDHEGLLRTNFDFTRLYSRPRGLYGNDSSIRVWDVSGSGAPVELPKIPGPVGTSSLDFMVDTLNGFAYMSDEGVSGIEVTRLSDGAMMIWDVTGASMGPAIGIAGEPGEAFVYAQGLGGDVVQFSLSGIARSHYDMGFAPDDQSLVITANDKVFSTSNTTLGVVGLSKLNVNTELHIRFGIQPSSGIFGKPINPKVVVEVLDPGGTPLFTYDSNITISIASGPGTLGGTLTVKAEKGVATFSDLTVSEPGTYVLQASDETLTITSAAFVRAVPKLDLMQAPVKPISGEAISKDTVVHIVDYKGDVITTEKSAVTVSLESGPGTLSGTLTVPAVNGVVTFSDLVITGPGDYVLRVSSEAYGTAFSGIITVESKTILWFAQNPSKVLVNTPMSPAFVVYITDRDYNTMVNDNSEITLSLQDGPGHLFGILTATAVDGVATFDNVWLDAPGWHDIRASSGTYRAGTTGVDVKAPVLAFMTHPTDVVAGRSLPRITVSLTDENSVPIPGKVPNVSVLLKSIWLGSTLGEMMSVTAVDGVATFDGLIPTITGQYRLVAAIGGAKQTESNTFEVRHAAAAQIEFSRQPNDVVAGEVIGVTPVSSGASVSIRARDAYGNFADIHDLPRARISIASGPDGARLFGNTSVRLGRKGGSFTKLKFTMAGEYTLIIKTDDLGSIESNSFTVLPAKPARMLYVQHPSHAIAGNAINPSIQLMLQDRYKNAVITTDSPVTLEIQSGPQGSTLGGTTIAHLVDGIATFSAIAITTAGRYRLRASVGELAARSNSFRISPAEVATISFVQQPTDVLLGPQVTPKIKLLVTDAFGNPIADGLTAALAINTGPEGAALGGKPSAKVRSGSARFSNVTLQTPGDYTLSATVGAVTAISEGFSVLASSPAPAAPLFSAILLDPREEFEIQFDSVS